MFWEEGISISDKKDVEPDSSELSVRPALRDRLYDRSRIDWDHLLFSGQDLKKLLLPLMFEQLLTSFMGMADTMMVSRIGSEAISAVSLTDSISVLIIQVLTALAAGGSILCSHYIGHGDKKSTLAAARQVLLVVTVVSVVVSVICAAGRGFLLRLIFGSVEPEVMTNAEIYFLLSAFSYPFVGLFEAGGALFRAGGNSKFHMEVSVLSNLLNIAGNAMLIFVFRWGVFGAALSTLLSRVLSAVIIVIALRLPGQAIVVRHYLDIRPDWHLIRKILYIGIPAGIENGMFQFGKLAIQSSVSTLGTIAIAAQAMAILFENLNGIMAMGIGIGLMTIVGQAIGAGRKEEAAYYIVKVTGYAEIVLTVSCLVVYLAAGPATWLAGMEPESAKLCMQMMLFITIVKPLVWTLSFIPAYGMRGAGDVRFSMIVSSITMWGCRVVLCTLLIRFFGFGPIAVWIGMGLDWTIRGICFTIRFLSKKWQTQSIA